MADEGLPIAYEVLEKGVPVYSSNGQSVGTVEHVVAAPQEDIFHGIVIRGGGGQRFVAADQVAALHEHGVDLRIDSATAAELPAPGGAAPALRLREPGVKPSRWRRILDELEGVAPTRRDWSEEE
jgi:sporulation protein YlmC with PRC-barrel domain